MEMECQGQARYISLRFVRGAEQKFFQFELREGVEKAPFTGPYFAPKYFIMQELVSIVSDIYSVGVIFAELVGNTSYLQSHLNVIF